ncbi:hypothetical protein Cob_v004316 [Colletotrichum orbiculare MAFF 240422]|uniref:Copper acquisition factor BIM1-like domain-containing protein n=1 Tax=Colletotrichum orbiculare (strain 104-T / ATCC 96160 / CBS 514.97 / LARS 414 / MAFF 240422) TaxID=1213857 RepID=N4VZY8_COLOR|nr:hypothetical protein Cob_v004316 [Colletotrichum orbiculare MAFF 240422]
MKTAASSIATLAGLFVALAQAHVAITYPGWRGNNLGSNKTFPFGLQWIYPCGAMDVTQNRTHWPIDGGSLAIQPGFMRGHESALMYVNIGFGEEPQNYTTVLVPMFHLTGPTNEAYNGTFCLPKIPLPDGVTPRNGDLASIQVVQAAKHGGALYSCVDIIFTDDESEVPSVTEDNCFNSTDLKVEAAGIAINSAPITEPTVTAVTTPSPTPTSGGSKMMVSLSGLVALMFSM